MLKYIFIAITSTLIFNCFQIEEIEIDKIDKTYEITNVTSSQSTIASNFVFALSTTPNELLIGTKGGGINSLNTDEKYKLYEEPDISSNFTVSLAGSSTLYATNIGSDGKYYADYYDGSSWQKNPIAAFSGGSSHRLSKVIFNGSNFYILEDRRIDGYLGINEKLSYIYSVNETTATSHQVNLDKLVNYSLAEADLTTMNGQAITDMMIDRDNDIIAAGYFWNNLTIRQMHLAIFRFKSDMSTKMYNTKEIKPIQFGLSFEIPTAMAYNDQSRNSYPYEEIYVATNKSVYKIPLSYYYDTGDIRAYDTTDGVPSNNVRSMLYAKDRLWVATDKGIGIFQSNWSSLTTSNSALPSDNIYDLAEFDNAIYAATDSGLFKITIIK